MNLSSSSQYLNSISSTQDALHHWQINFTTVCIRKPSWQSSALGWSRWWMRTMSKCHSQFSFSLVPTSNRSRKLGLTNIVYVFHLPTLFLVWVNMILGIHLRTEQNWTPSLNIKWSRLMLLSVQALTCTSPLKE